MLHTCERKYYFQYLAPARIDSYDETLRKIAFLRKVTNIPMWRGKVFHSLIAEHLSEVRKGNKVQLNDLLTGYKQRMREQWKSSANNSFDIGNTIQENAFLLQEHLYKETVSENTLLDTIRDLEKRTEQFQRWAEDTSFYAEVIQSPQVLIEPPTYSRETLSFNLDGVQIITKVDLVLASEGQFAIFDWKTSKPVRSARMLPQVEFQAAVYQLCPHFKLGTPLNDISARFVYFMGNDFKQQLFRIDENMREYTLNLIRRSISRMRYFDQIDKNRTQLTLNESPRFTLNDLDFAYSEKSCIYCPFKQICLRELE